MSTDILTISEAATLIKTGKLSPVELTEMCLERVDAFEPELHAFVTLTKERARADAKRAEAEIKAWAQIPASRYPHRSQGHHRHERYPHNLPVGPQYRQYTGHRRHLRGCAGWVWHGADGQAHHP